MKRKDIEFTDSTDSTDIEKFFNKVISDAYVEQEGDELHFVFSGEEYGEGLTPEQKEVYDQNRSGLDKLTAETMKEPPKTLNELIKVLCRQGELIFNILSIQNPENDIPQVRKDFINKFAFNILKAAAELKEEKENAENGTPPEPVSEMVRRAVKSISALEVPIDKANSNIWDVLHYDKKQVPGQQSIAFGLDTRSGEEKKIDARNGDTEEGDLITVSIDFKALEESENVRYTRAIDAYDRNLYIHVAALYMAGNTEVTLKDIYRAMHKSDQPVKPAINQIQKIAERLDKMRFIDIIIDNQKEVEKYGHKKPLYTEYRVRLLPCDLKLERATKNNKENKERTIIDGKLIIQELPFFIKFAKERNEIITVKRDVLAIPLNYTPENLKIRDYIITRIKKHGFNGSIYLDTLFEACHIERRDARHRAVPKIETILKHFKEEGEIKDFEIKAGVIKINK